ncbi:TPA: transposase [Acinetobacter baumannii]|uniref:Transposase n=1 Tax=Acinetobacter baumannii TaxID=470 RepID=A0A335GMQ5_ACIBA|nr:transposase [Acinetobacter baumannii]SSP01743.1 Transposase [Acinetobacter baumannii]SST34050.1 Transposase [Acinetobacter baumannii]HCE0843172.1 transposase [Acinetobacter baumannii]HCE0934187.1 transposase [Acinetobacter baumannii]
MSYSEHFRRKILAKLEEGYSIRAVAAQFEINKNTIVEWKKRIEIKKTRVRRLCCTNLSLKAYSTI